MSSTPVSQLKGCLKNCNAKATHLCKKCKCVGYCCMDCQTSDKSTHASMCKRLTDTQSKSKSKSQKTTIQKKTKSNKGN